MLNAPLRWEQCPGSSGTPRGGANTITPDSAGGIPAFWKISWQSIQVFEVLNEGTFRKNGFRE
jgi:hypothetical protein